jgi:hypothetical protein
MQGKVQVLARFLRVLVVGFATAFAGDDAVIVLGDPVGHEQTHEGNVGVLLQQVRSDGRVNTTGHGHGNATPSTGAAHRPHAGDDQKMSNHRMCQPSKSMAISLRDDLLDFTLSREVFLQTALRFYLRRPTIKTDDAWCR